MMEYPAVAIAILNWNGKKYLDNFLPFLQDITYPAYTIYVIDNNSNDDSVLFLQQQYPLVNIIRLDDNYGFAGGYNRGLQQVREDYYLLLNSDVEVDPFFLESLMNTMLADKQIAACQPKVLSFYNRQFFERAGAAGGMMDVLGYPFCRGRMFDDCEQDKGQYNNEKEIFWATGTCCLIRKEAYVRVSGMYEYFFMHMEEIDMCWRFISDGYTVKYCPDSVVYHIGGGSLPYQSATKTYYNFRNNIVMCIRNSPLYSLVWLLPLRMMMDAIAALQFLLRRNVANATAVCKAYIHFFKWLFSRHEKKFALKKTSLGRLPAVTKKSIVWNFFVKGIKTFSELENR